MPLTRVSMLLLLFFLAAPPQAADVAMPDPLFRDTAALQVTITAPLTTLLKEKSTEEYLQGVFEYTDGDDEIRAFDVKIRARGHLRHEVCEFPPIWVNFKKSEVKNTLFHKQDKLKLVVHCANSIRYEQAVVREYLAYRILNLATPLSFQVRLLRVRYVDSEGKRDDQVRYAFFLEHKNRIGKRIDAEDLKIEETEVERIQPDHLNLTSVFEYLIGNTDFSPIAPSPYDECCHNYDMFGNDSDLLIAIPYDFDQAGFVNAPYAAPSEQFPIRSVRQRIYRGRCANNEHVPASLQRFQEIRESIYTMLKEHEGLTSMTRRALIAYVDNFYKVIDDSVKVERSMVEKCI
jgi:hypothetical protein